MSEIPEIIANAIKGHPEEEFLIQAYLEMDEHGRAFILDFFVRGPGVTIARQVVLKHQEGVPTSSELEEWFEEQ